MDIIKRREKDREYKKLQRRLNTDCAIRTRDNKRSEDAKKRRNELRKRPEQKQKEKIYAREYRKRPEVKKKNSSRYKAKWALIKGIIKRPECCEICGAKDVKLSDGRSSLRMDHYMGYDHPLKVKFVCVKCDGQQEIDRGNTSRLKV